MHTVIAAGLSIMLTLALASPGVHAAQTSSLATSDVRVEVRAAQSAPGILQLSGPAAGIWRNRDVDPLPGRVEINGSVVPVIWHNVPQANIADAHHVVFVYESMRPRLRLQWEWEARAAFGPNEHRTTIENLGTEEVWLPMIDSLRVTWEVPAGLKLRSLYIEKGADAPSAQAS